MKLVEEVDEDGSGEIEFNEFLEIIKGGSKKARAARRSTDPSSNQEEEFNNKEAISTAAIYTFFK